MKLPPDWTELIGLLCAEGVRFVVVGAHALAVHGRPRATGDLDLFVEPTAENARRLGAALAAFGFPALARQARRFAEPDRMATLGQEPLRIDLMTGISGVSFEQAWRSRVKVRLGPHEVGFLGRRAFIANKRAAGRPHDALDLALLAEARPRRRRRVAGPGSQRTTKPRNRGGRRTKPGSRARLSCPSRGAPAPAGARRRGGR